ncbi:MAG: DUF881 domain-containing protein [Bacillota bacterium]|nr:DUF881 domain-containing protein [Bacillota bacterium]
MSDNSARHIYRSGKIQLIILIIVLVNTALIALGYYFLIYRLTSTDTLLAYKQELARDIADYNHRLAKDLGVNNLSSVREALAEYNYALDQAGNSEDLIQVILKQGQWAQETIYRESDARLRDNILQAVRSDNQVRGTVERMHLFIRIENGNYTVYPDQYLESATLQRINALLVPNRHYGNQHIDLEIFEGDCKLALPQTPEEQLSILNEDLSALRQQLHETRVEAGLADMAGPGITLYLYDAPDTQVSASLVHDADVRDIVNELFSAGAKGISVGGQRLTATSGIRCTGPLIMVNYRQIASNPVVIQAVGDPDLLISGLKIILNDLETRRGLIFEVSQSGFILLPAYKSFD